MECQYVKQKQTGRVEYNAEKSTIEMENTVHTALILKRTKQFAKNATEMGIATNAWRDMD